MPNDKSAADKTQVNKPYRGRFAPSPTGPLHMGSLIAAVASYLQAKSRQGIWLVRMEDLDQGREQAGAARHILNSLEAFGLHWDEAVVYQNQRLPLYDMALEELRSQHLLYPCACSRRDIENTIIRQQTAQIPAVTLNRYPGICRDGIKPGNQARSIRIKTDNKIVGFTDRIQGQFEQAINREVGDFVLKRADGFYAYQLAVVVDDAAQGITEVVRGSDLLDNTARQIYLQQLLSLPQPGYLHHPVAVNNVGEKLSKQTFATALDARQPLPTLMRVLSFLGQRTTTVSDFDNLDDFWHWSIEHWQWQNIPRCITLPEPV